MKHQTVWLKPRISVVFQIEEQFVYYNLPLFIHFPIDPRADVLDILTSPRRVLFMCLTFGYSEWIRSTSFPWENLNILILLLYISMLLLICTRFVFAADFLLRRHYYYDSKASIWFCTTYSYIYIIRYYFIYYTRIGVPTCMYNNNNIICILHVLDEFNRIIISNVPIYVHSTYIPTPTSPRYMLRTVGRAVSINVSLPRL